MSKLYFDCPVKAAYMAKEFGVSLYLGDYAKGDYDKYSARNWWHIQDDWLYRNKPETPMKPVDKIYVHPESLPIFEPRDYDLDSEGSYYFSDADGGYWLSSAGAYKDSDGIIFRDGKPFIMPKKEG